MVYMVTFAINIHPMLAYIPYMDPMGKYIYIRNLTGQLSHDRQSSPTSICQS